ncbi:MAG: c-type cytochrome [Thiohalospira sp.]|uniref:c-type cytochrome n=1 Tax=Thiohalospira sp. TaxID=3080549 RepID=UPI003980751E
MKNTAITALFLMGAATSAQAIDGDPEAGKEKSSKCVACHQEDGNSQSDEYPKIAGQHADYLFKQLKEFKEKKTRSSDQMTGMVADLDEQDMKDLAAYYSSQEVKIGEADEKLVDQGRQIYRAGAEADGIPACMACHGPSGKGNPAANFPRLGGQHTAYTVTQLQDFKAGDRSNDAGQMMRNIADKMSEEQMEAVGSYIEGLSE